MFYSNIVLDPLIYTGGSPTFRTRIRELCSPWWKACRGSKVVPEGCTITIKGSMVTVVSAGTAMSKA